MIDTFIFLIDSYKEANLLLAILNNYGVTWINGRAAYSQPLTDRSGRMILLLEVVRKKLTRLENVQEHYTPETFRSHFSYIRRIQQGKNVQIIKIV